MRNVLRFVLLMLLTGTAGRVAEGAATDTDPECHAYRIVDGDSLCAFVFLPERKDGVPANAILLFHGGGWSSGSAEWVFPTAERFATWGLVAIAVEYRLSQGDVTPIEALDDVCTAFAWARAHAEEFGIGAKLAGYGVSAGGHLVAASATVGCGGDRRGPDALLLSSPALDVAADGWFAKLLQGRGKPTDYSPALHVGKSTPATCIIQGREDTLTPLSGAQKFHDSLVALGGVCELNVYDGVGHLLTRNLANQESDFDPDPEKRADGIEKQRQFLLRLGFIVEAK